MQAIYEAEERNEEGKVPYHGLGATQYTLSREKFLQVGMCRATEYQPKVAEWMWFPYVPMGKITIIQGDPGEGKTTLSLALAAQMTLPAEQRLFGNKTDEEYSRPFDVLYLTAEDGFEDTILPRFINAGGDVHHLYTIADVEGAPDELTFFDERVTIWLENIAAMGHGLIIFDPIQAFLGSGTDMHRANEIRPVMRRLGAMADIHNVPIILIGHQNKQQGSKAIYRGLGSIDIAAAARSVLEVERHPQEKSRRIIRHVKSSLAERAEPSSFEFLPDGGIAFSKTFQEAEIKHVQTAVDRAVVLLYKYLRNEEGKPEPMKTKHLEALMATDGISLTTLNRARAKLHCRTFQKDGSHWVALASDSERVSECEPAGSITTDGITQERET